jgi:hypothetical protein
VITRCNSSRPLYTMHLPSHPAPSPHVSASSVLVASTSTWHRRLGHSGVDVLSKMSHDSSLIFSRCTHDLCHASQLGRHTHLTFISSNSHADNNVDLIHCDLGTSLIVSISGYKYYLVILDDHSHFVCTFPLRVKFDTFSLCQFFLLMSPHSLAAPLKPSSAIMTVSLIMPPLAHSSPSMGYFCGCLVHTLLRGMVKPSTSSAPLVICHVPCFFRLLFRLASG